MTTSSTPQQPVNFVTYPVEFQQEHAHALCELFDVHDGELHHHDLGGERLKDDLNAMYRELAIYQDEARRSEDFHGVTSENPNHTPSAFGTLINTLCRFIDRVSTVRMMEAAVAVDPYQHIAQEEVRGFGFKPIAMPPSEARFVVNLAEATVTSPTGQPAAEVKEETESEAQRRAALARVDAAQDRILKAKGYASTEEHTAAILERFAEEAEAKARGASEPIRTPELTVVNARKSGAKRSRGKRSHSGKRSRTAA